MPDMADMEEKVFNLNSKLTRRLWVLFFRLINAVNAQPESVLRGFASPKWGLAWLSSGGSELGKQKPPGFTYPVC